MIPCRIVAVLVAVAAAGQISRAAGATPQESVAERMVAAHERNREWSTVGFARARLSRPQKLSGSVAAVVARKPAEYECTTACQYRGLLLQVEPGLGGGQVCAGYGVVVGGKGRRRQFLDDVFLAYGVKAALLRTWGDSGLEPEQQTRLGLEGDLTFIRINLTLGVFRHVGGGPADDPWLVGGGIGWTF